MDEDIENTGQLDNPDEDDGFEVCHYFLYYTHKKLKAYVWIYAHKIQSKFKPKKTKAKKKPIASTKKKKLKNKI